MALDINQWLDNNTVSLSGRVVVITGATGGLGRHVVRDLLKTGAKIIMLERSMIQSRVIERISKCGSGVY